MQFLPADNNNNNNGGAAANNNNNNNNGGAAANNNNNNNNGGAGGNNNNNNNNGGRGGNNNNNSKLPSLSPATLGIDISLLNCGSVASASMALPPGRSLLQAGPVCDNDKLHVDTNPLQIVGFHAAAALKG